MSKPVQPWPNGLDPVPASFLRQTVKDYVTPGLPIFNCSGFWFVDNRTGIITSIVSDKVLGWYPYNGDKSVYDRLRILFGYSLISGATFTNLEYSLDTGGTWNNALAGAVAPSVDLNLANEFMNTFSLTGITGSQWIGVRISLAFDVTDESAFNFYFSGFLYNLQDSGHDPF